MLQLPLGWSVSFWQHGSPLEIEQNVSGLALGKCLEHISQDEALGHEGELFKGTKGNLTPLEFHALENLSSHSIFLLDRQT